MCSCGESLSSSGSVTFHMHSSHVSRLSIAYSGSVLNNVGIATIRTSSWASAHRRRISSKGCIQSALFTASWFALRRFTCIASETPQKRLPAAISAVFVSACRPNCSSVLVRGLRCSEEGSARVSHVSVIHWNAILINVE